MNLSEKEVLRIRKSLMDIDRYILKPRAKFNIQNKTRIIRLILTKAERREKNTLL